MSKKVQINIDTSNATTAQDKAVPLENPQNLGATKSATPSTPMTPFGEEYRDPKDFKLILADPNFDLCKQFKLKFGRWIRKGQNYQQALWGHAFPNVSIKCLPFEEVHNFDCMVSAANSFGLMDGGVDAAITQFFGDQVEMRVQQHILRFYDGEQPVGSSFIIPTFHNRHPYLAHTPTLRVPYSIQQTDNVYLAMKAMLRAVADHNERALLNPQEASFIETVVCPGLGTNNGHMDLQEAARQMATAYDNFYNTPRAIDWGFANERQRKVIWGGNPENGQQILRKLMDIKYQEPEPSTPLVAPSFPEELQEDSKITHISKMDFYNLTILNDYLLVDTRDSSEFAESSIHNSFNVPANASESFDSIQFPQVELNHTILVAHGDVEQDQSQKSHLTSLLDFFALRKSTKNVYVLADHYNVFAKTYPFLCGAGGNNQNSSDDVFPNHLLPHLFLSSALVANNPDAVKKVGLTHLLSTETRLVQRRNSTGFVPIPDTKFLQLNCDEEDEKSIRKFYDDAIQFIDEAKEQRGRVLVFCNRGESRGPCVAVVYLMRTLMWTWDEAAAYVKRARPVFEPVPALEAVAKQIEIELFNVEQD